MRDHFETTAEQTRDDGRRIVEPFTTNIEIEFTNVCNAQCAACPRSDMPQHGFMRPGTLDDILALYDSSLDYQGSRPSVTVAGGGEPLLNRDAIGMLRTIVAHGHATNLITNASAITRSKAAQLAQCGLHSICVSFWGVRKKEYERAMQLAYEQVLTKVEGLRDALKGSPTDLQIIWVRTPEIESTDAEVKAFWDKRFIAVDLDDTAAWNRGGLLPKSASGVGNLPDPARRIWCADLFFSDTFNWRGEVLLCCCNYFTSRQVRLAVAAKGGLAAVRAAKRSVLQTRPLPSMCTNCSLPRGKRARFLLKEHFDRLSSEEKSELTVFADDLLRGETP